MYASLYMLLKYFTALTLTHTSLSMFKHHCPSPSSLLSPSPPLPHHKPPATKQDFKQTGTRLQGVVAGLMEDSMRLVIDARVGVRIDQHADTLLTCVYKEDWSVQGQECGMKLV